MSRFSFISKFLFKKVLSCLLIFIHLICMRAFPMAQQQRICLPIRRCQFNPWVGNIPWKRKWESTPVFMPRKSHGQRSLVRYSPWSCTESDITEAHYLYEISAFITQHAAAAAKLLQSCLTLCDPRDSSPPGSSVPGILQVRTLEWVAISFSNA